MGNLLQSSPGQVGGGLTGGMFSAAAQNPLLANTDLSQATIAGAMPGAPSYFPGGQMPGGGNPIGGGINMQNLPALLRQGSTMVGGGGMGGLGGGGATGGGGRGMQDISQGMQAGASLISMLSMLGAF